MSVVLESVKRQEIVRFIEADVLPNNPPWCSITVHSPGGSVRYMLKPELDLSRDDQLRGVCEDGSPFQAAWDDIMAVEIPDPS